MENHKIARNFLWMARIWGSFLLAFLVFFVIGHLIGSDKLMDGLSTSKEWINFLLFPASTILGLMLAYKWEGLGGLVICLGLIALFFLQNDLITNPYFVGGIAPSGILYLLYWYFSKK